jgi:hypothetical protein
VRFSDMIPGYDAAARVLDMRARASWRASTSRHPRFGGACSRACDKGSPTCACAERLHDRRGAPLIPRCSCRWRSCSCGTCGCGGGDRAAARGGLRAITIPEDEQPGSAVVLHRLLGPDLVALRGGHPCACTSDPAGGAYTPPRHLRASLSHSASCRPSRTRPA